MYDRYTEKDVLLDKFSAIILVTIYGIFNENSSMDRCPSKYHWSAVVKFGFVTLTYLILLTLKTLQLSYSLRFDRSQVVLQAIYFCPYHFRASFWLSFLFVKRKQLVGLGPVGVLIKNEPIFVVFL